MKHYTGNGPWNKGYQPSGIQDPLRVAALELVAAVEQYVEPRPGEKYMHRTKVLAIKNNSKELLK